jgi:gamma-glutamylcysteine synthetase
LRKDLQTALDAPNKSVMQTIAGIHFNYSFAQDFLKQYHLLKAPSEVFRLAVQKLWSFGK